MHPLLPECFIRVAGFDNIKQVQCSFLAHRPTNDRTFAPVNGRQAGGDSSMGGGGGYGAPAPPSPPAAEQHQVNTLLASTRS